MTNKSSENKKVFVQFGPTSEEAMFFRLSSAAEAIVFFIIIFNVFPSLYSKRNRSSFYPRMCITYVLILIIIIIRFYDFLDSNIFRSLGKDHKIRFLLYGLATIEAMFDLSLVAMGVEILLELCNTIMVEKRKWVLYGSVTAGIPASFLLLILIIWESKHQFEGVLGVALAESILPATVIIIITLAIYVVARKKKMSISEDFLIRIKTILLINTVAMVGMLLNLLLYSLNAEVVMDDLIDAIVKLGVVACYIMVQPHHMAAPYMFSSLDVQETAMETSVQPIVLQNEPENRITGSTNSRAGPGQPANRDRPGSGNGSMGFGPVM